jgi:heme A synthase
MKPLLIILGTLSAILIVSQVVLGVMMKTGQASPGLAKSHFHLGTTMAVVVLVYIALSLTAILSKPRREVSP